jgi:hypothetical protein
MSRCRKGGETVQEWGTASTFSMLVNSGVVVVATCGRFIYEHESIYVTP